jgi:1-acyl-sn-glycerol-3-phosphate acyltransferase
MLSALTIVLAYVVLALPAAAIGIPWALLTGNIGLLYRWSMWILRTGVKLARIRVEVAGILYPELPFRTAFFLKRSLMKIPILGTGMRLANFVPVDRDGRLESARESVRAGSKVLASGVNISMFPEGTRSRDGRLLPFKKGPFYLAMESGAPVVPVSIWGSEHMMTKGSLRIRPGTAHLAFHPALDPRQFATREELMVAVRASITSALPRWMWADKAAQPTPAYPKTESFRRP